MESFLLSHKLYTKNANFNLQCNSQFEVLPARFLFRITILVCLKESTRKRAADQDFAAEVVSFSQKSKINVSSSDYFPNSVVNDSTSVYYHILASFCYSIRCHCHTSSSYPSHLAWLGPHTPHQIWLIPHQQNLRSEMRKVNPIVDDNVKQQLESNDYILNLETRLNDEKPRI